LLLLFVKVPGFTLLPAIALPAFALMVTGFFIPTLRVAKGTVSLLCAAAIAACSGLILRFIALEIHLVTNSPTQLSMILLWVFAFPLLVVAGYWALERVDVFRGVVVTFAGAAAASILNAQEFSWKGNLGIFVTLVFLALAARKLQLTRVILAGSAVANALSDSRTMALIAVIVLLCTYLTSTHLDWVRQNPKKSLFLITGGFLTMSLVMAQAMLSGLMGQDIRRRTLLQVSGGRDLITAGRTEWAASLELFKQSPLGFGAGVTPGGGMQTDAIDAVQLAGGDYSNAFYWTYSVFGERTDLHSTLANLWVHFSVGGVILAVAIATVFAAATPNAVGLIRNLGAWPLFAVLTGSWDLLFSPMGNSDRIIMALLAAAVLIYLHRNPSKAPAPVERKIRQRRSALNKAHQLEIACERYGAEALTSPPSTALTSHATLVK
jgi:hypothetical protein